MKKHTIKLNESQLRNIIKEVLNELDWKTYRNAANKRLAQGKYANANELSDMAKNRFDDEFNDNYRYDTFGAKLAGKHSKTFDSTFIPTEEPSLQGRNEKGEELFRNKGRYYNSRRGLTTPEKFFKDKEMSDTFNTATQELDNYNNGNYDYTPEKGWHLKESRLNNIIKESIKNVLREACDENEKYTLADETHIEDLCYGDLLQNVRKGNTAIVERPGSDGIRVVSGLIPIEWVKNWKLIARNILGDEEEAGSQPDSRYDDESSYRNALNAYNEVGH